MGTMYKPQNNGPHTELAATINAGQSSITVTNASVLPEAPNVLTIGTEEDAELVEVQRITGNILTVQRGFNGTTAKAWDAGAWIYRGITAQDIEELQKRAAVAVTYEAMSLTEEQKAQVRTNVGALASDGTAADSSKLGGRLPEEYMLAADAGNLGGLEMDLLWVNASPASSFAAQSVTLDLTEYTHFLIFVSIKYSTGIEVYGICEKAGKYRIGAAGTTNRFRDAAPSDSGIAFGDGYNVAKYDSATVYNDEMVPTKIYGIKGVNMTV